MSGLLWRSELRWLRHNPWSCAVVVLGVALGVASVVAVHQINLRVNATLAAATPVHLVGVTHLLEQGVDTTPAASYFALRAGWRGGELPYVKALLPIVEGSLQAGEQRWSVFGTDWLAASSLQQQSRLQGLALLGRDAVIVDSSLGLADGAELTLGGVPTTVVASVESGMGAAVFADIGTAQAILQRDPHALSYVAVVRADPAARVSDLLERALPGSSAGFQARLDEWQVPGWQVRPVVAELPTVGFARSILFNVGALGSLTLVVAWFLIHQVAVVWHRQRLPLLERLQVLGVARRTLRANFIALFAVAGTVATALGLVLGPLLAALLSVATGATIAEQGLDGWAAGKGVASGIGVSVLGAWMASRPQSFGWHWRGVLLVGLLLIAMVGTHYQASGLIGAFAAVFAVCLVAVLVVRPALAVLRRIRVRGGGGMLARIGGREVVWHSNESSVAIGALALAVGASMGVAIMVDNFRDDFARMLAQRLAHDYFVSAAGRTLHQPAQWLARNAPEADVQLYGRARHRLGEWSVELGYTDFSAREAARYGLDRPLAHNEVLLSERLARALGVAPGELVADGGLRVVGTFPGFGEPNLRALVQQAAAQQLGVATNFDRLSVSGLTAGQLAELTATYPALRVQSQSELRRLALDVFDRTFAVTRVLTLLSLFVASVGMYNALLALRLNRLHTERLLQVLGVSFWQRLGIAARRAGFVGAWASALALPLGLSMAYLLCEVVNPRAFGWSLQFAPGAVEVVGPMLLAVCVALLTGLLPVPPGERVVAEVDGV